MSSHIICTLCQSQLLIPANTKKEFVRNHSFTCSCKAQYQYSYDTGSFFLIGFQLRFTGWNMWYNFRANSTRFVKMERRNKDIEINKKREEYNFDGLILPKRFMELKVFL